MDQSMQKMLETLLNSANVPPEVRNAVTAAMSDPARLDEALAQLKAIGADQVGSGPPLNIEDYYKPGPGTYELRWPLGLNVPLPMSFEELDRKTQFFVLFQEWTRRELEGMMLLNSGDVGGAEIVFAECLERAAQIDVRELEARSYEGFVRVAQKRGDRNAEVVWLRKAAAARRT
jgi:hypothetical protein